ncbi:4Fe-4S double cluster binding domain-containing protein [Fusibacter ferrireducens]|uniref:4Fe-4S ferredoxin-type domain-containing protein n=1 Tax=Fusibacter ferrireducens TaxID=2785058 RepID=A0ABR9ZP37_9FIRM|nr:4Fe-4S double cluster binding domain-containing protein [Fusibacter ferrireducens]MBF4692222.1 hypothetical protein [Fusibacter ferrireducens]
MTSKLKMIETELKNLGLKSSFLSIDDIPRIESTYHQNVYRDEANVHSYEKYLKNIRFTNDNNIKMESILTIAVYQPHSKISFNMDGHKVTRVLPSMYLYDVDPLDQNRNSRVMTINNDIQNLLESYGHMVSPVYLPAKTIAIASGLAKMGKNNLCYIDGCSFYWFATYLTDIHVDKESIKPTSLFMKECEHCSKCINNCPTGALNPSHSYVKINKCLTYHNESLEMTPVWIDRKWHNSMIGCIRCQSVCPLNHKHMKKIKTFESFNEHETKEILAGNSIDSFPEESIRKLKNINFFDNYKLLTRNLSLLEKRAD